MIISVINKKGGVGKTSFAFSIAKDLGLYLQSNDASIIESIYPKMSKISEKPQLIDNCVFDFGGFVSHGILEIAKKSDFIIVPCTTLYNSILRSVETINEIKPINDRIIVLNTDYNNQSDREQVENALSENFTDLEFFNFKHSKILENAMRSGATFRELAADNPLARISYKNFIDEYERLLQKLQGIL